MTEKEISRVLRGKYKRKPGCPHRARASKMRMRYGRDWDRLCQELKRTREKLDILMDLQREHEQRMIAQFVKEKHG